MTKTSQVTDPRADAEQEAAEAEALIAALEERVRDGDTTVSAEQIAAQESVARFARLRADAARRTAEQERQAAHLAACTALRKEIEKAGRTDNSSMAEDLHAFEEAALRFVAAASARNAQVADWRHRMQALGVPAGLFGDDRYAGLGLSGHTSALHAGGTTFDAIKPEQHLGRILSRIQDETKIGVGPLRNAAHERAYEILAAELGTGDQ